MLQVFLSVVVEANDRVPGSFKHRPGLFVLALHRHFVIGLGREQTLASDREHKLVHSVACNGFRGLFADSFEYRGDLGRYLTVHVFTSMV